MTGPTTSAIAASADLWQARNGTADLPSNPVQWAKGNAGPGNSHYIEGHSVPYRLVATGLSNGTHKLVLEWDTEHKGKQAFDYITHYDRLAPHAQFAAHVTAEMVNPLDGITGSFGTPSQSPIPAPSSIGSPVTGQPAESFNALPAEQRMMTIWNGTITRLAYVTEEPLTGESAVTRLAVDFVADNETVVIAWGGHIASKFDWGSGNSAISIGGSPYHMRKISLDGSGGNQDRSVQALAVSSPPTSVVTGPSSVCALSTNTYTVTTDSKDTVTSYQWSLANNTADAFIVGSTDGSLVEIVANSAGTYSLQAIVVIGGAKGVESFNVSVTPSTTISLLADQTVCPGSDVTFTVTPAGTAPLTVTWSKDGQVIPGATNDALILGNVAAADAGRYCVEVAGTCGSASSCANLTVESAPVLVGPPDLIRECLSDVPPADPASVQVNGGAGLVTVLHAGDAIQTNDCDILVVRIYQATDSCNSQASWHQTITVRDTKPPTFTTLPDRSVECGLDWTFDVPSVTDECDGTSVTLTVVGTVTNGLCGKTYAATRTWQASDRCGNSATVTQTITVIDTTAPVITCVPNRIVECGVVWDFDQPTATDICDGSDVVVSVTATITNALTGNLLESTRTWLATDACGNTATCRQTVTVADTTAPEIVCTTNTVVPCAGSEGTIVSFPVSATDTCNASVQTTCVPPSGSVFPIGTTTVQCAATDVNGNVGLCSFTVSVIDVIPPRITCPADIFVVEDAPGSGHVTVDYPTPAASDDCDTNPVVACSPPAGSIFPLGDTTVLCVATDASSNTNACSFQVRVVPRTIAANSTADSGPGSLRQALLDANAAPGSNVVAFAFDGTAPYIIRLLSPLPVITDPVTIDGWSQLEFRGQPVIELDGSNAIPSGIVPASEGAVVAGLNIVAGNSEVRGLALNGFEVGILIAGSGGNIIQGNFIGTDASGSTALGNTADGIRVHSAGNQIGGEAAATRNVISGNRGNGLVLDGSNAVNNIIQGNLIGLADESMSPLGNSLNGIVLKNSAADNRIGPDNVIAFNDLNAVLLEPTAGNGNAIRGNAIFSNGALGIDLGGDGSTPNDDEDADTGPNQLQNVPVLTLAQTTGESTIIAGTLSGSSNSVFQIDFFLNTTASGSGGAFLGSATVETDATSQANFSTTLPVTVPTDQFITATATDAGNNTSEFSLPVQVGGPPVILTQPLGNAINPGASLTLCVAAAGSQPLTYQWRLNGANIPDATNTCFTIESAQLTDGGSYTVVVANDLGVITSDPAVLRLILPPVAVADNFADRVPLTGVDGLVAWNNKNATREPGESNHAGKPGGKSVWYTWTAPATGIATFSAVGSAFDTLLAVYVGGSVSNLTLVESDEDRGGFFTSIVRFNAIAGTEYQIVIDGFGAASGEFVFGWQFEATEQLLPVISKPPVGQTVVAGSSVTFTVNARGGCPDKDDKCDERDHDGDDKDDKDPKDPKYKDPLTYQWYLNGVAIPGATQSSLTVTNVQEINVGIYTVVVTGENKQFVETQPVSLQINETGPTAQSVQAKDKFLDAANSTPLSLGTPSGIFAPLAESGETPIVAAAIVRSYTSTQVFSSAGGTTSADERLLCYGVGGASEWFAVVTEEPGVLYVNTDGSSYDTVMAVYTYAPANSGLMLLGCDNNSGKDGKDSALGVPVSAGQTNFVVIDGFNGAFGVASLHFSLVTPGSLTPLGFTAQKAFKLRLEGQPAMRFTIQASSNLVNWTSLLTNSSTSGSFEYTDSKSTNAPRRFYRALMLP